MPSTQNASGDSHVGKEGGRNKLHLTENMHYTFYPHTHTSFLNAKTSTRKAKYANMHFSYLGISLSEAHGLVGNKLAVPSL